jgi:hypothetical protein
MGIPIVSPVKDNLLPLASVTGSLLESNNTASQYGFIEVSAGLTYLYFTIKFFA